VKASELRDWCLAMPGAVEEFPFAPETSVFKIAGKIFALSRLGAAPLKVSLKCEPLNKKHWLTITVGEDAGDQMVLDLIQDSYDLVKPKRRSPSR
jgi:predicted DNA-binding protein (MmcQ/YjbR family)